MNDPDDDIPAPKGGGERTVMVSAEDLARLHGEAPAAAAAPDPFAVPADPFAAASPADPFAATPIAAPSAAAPEPEPVIAASVPPPPVAAMLHGTPGALVGMHLNDLFEIVRFIAQGGMGEVYEGRNLASGERVAIKVILPQYAADEQFMALFRREASALERIGHDSLVKYRTLAFDRTNRVNYLAIEYVSGPSMAEVLTGEPADPAVVRRVLKRLATGLGAAHEAGVIHRDLSPDNLLLPDGNVERAKIIDFGIAKDTNPGEKSVVGEAFAGKFGYAAPEIFGKFKRAVGPWTDVYSLALVMIAFARGAPLDMGVTIVDALEARDTVPDLSSLSPDLQPVFARMLAPDPAERFRSMDEVVAALDAPRGSVAPSPFGGDAPSPAVGSSISAASAPAFVRATTPPPRDDAVKPSRLPLYGGIAAAVVLVAAGGGYLLLGGKSAPTPTAPVPATESTASAPAATAPAASVPVASAPAAAAPDWTSARPAVLAALNAVDCSDLHIAGPPEGGRVRLTGWHSSAASVPASAGGLTLDSSGAASVAAPSPATCALVAKIRAAAPDGQASGFTMPPSQSFALDVALRHKGPDGAPLIDLKPSGKPSTLEHVLIANIDDRARSAKERVVSADVADAKLDLSALAFDAKPGRYLAVLVAGPEALPPVTADGANGLAAKCGSGGCAMTSGWIEITR